jgi:hypothetical protein
VALDLHVRPGDRVVGGVPRTAEVGGRHRGDRARRAALPRGTVDRDLVTCGRAGPDDPVRTEGDLRAAARSKGSGPVEARAGHQRPGLPVGEPVRIRRGKADHQQVSFVETAGHVDCLAGGAGDLVQDDGAWQRRGHRRETVQRPRQVERRVGGWAGRGRPGRRAVVAVGVDGGTQDGPGANRHEHHRQGGAHCAGHLRPASAAKVLHGSAEQDAQVGRGAVEELTPMGDDSQLIPGHPADAVVTELQDRRAGQGGEQR